MRFYGFRGGCLLYLEEQSLLIKLYKVFTMKREFQVEDVRQKLLTDSCFQIGVN